LSLDAVRWPRLVGAAPLGAGYRLVGLDLLGLMIDLARR
jgi:hypothetical protein